MYTRKCNSRGWRDGSFGVKIVFWSSRAPEFSSQNPLQSSSRSDTLFRPPRVLTQTHAHNKKYFFLKKYDSHLGGLRKLFWTQIWVTMAQEQYLGDPKFHIPVATVWWWFVMVINQGTFQIHWWKHWVDGLEQSRESLLYASDALWEPP